MTNVPVVNAQEPTQIVSINPLGLVFGIANVEYQANISDDSAWAVRGLYWGYSVGDLKWSLVGAGGSYRVFPYCTCR